MAGKDAVDPAEALTTRVNEFARATLERDPLALFPLYWSGYREAVPLNRFLDLNLGNVFYEEYSLAEIREVEEDRATVVMHTRFEAMGFLLDRPVVQEWIIEDGEWFIKVEPVVYHPMSDRPAPIK